MVVGGYGLGLIAIVSDCVFRDCGCECLLFNAVGVYGLWLLGFNVYGCYWLWYRAVGVLGLGLLRCWDLVLLGFRV